MEFKVQLANSYWDNKKVVENREFYITTKIDGERIFAIKVDGEVGIFSRDNKPINGLVEIEWQLHCIPWDNFIIDGELTLLNRENLTSKEQYKKTMEIARTKGEKHGLKMLVFDCIPIHDSITAGCMYKYSTRRTIFNGFHYKYIEALPVLYHGCDTNVIEKILDEQIAKGEEGIMINLADAPYMQGRTNALLKVKRMKDLDLKVIGYEEGKGKNEGKLGALIVDYKGNQVKVGTGFSDSIRKEIWEDRDNWLGKIITVRYFEETPEKNGKVSLRFPVYVDWRDDKSEASC